MPPNSKYHSGLNEKQCWDLWWSEGTLDKAVQALFAQGICNPKTGKPITGFGLQLAAWRYACKNIPAALDDFRKDYARRNIPFDDYAEEQFYVHLVKAAKRIFTTRRTLDKFFANNDLEKYRKFLS